MVFIGNIRYLLFLITFGSIYFVCILSDIMELFFVNPMISTFSVQFIRPLSEMVLKNGLIAYLFMNKQMLCSKVPICPIHSGVRVGLGWVGFIVY